MALELEQYLDCQSPQIPDEVSDAFVEYTRDSGGQDTLHFFIADDLVVETSNESQIIRMFMKEHGLKELAVRVWW